MDRPMTAGRPSLREQAASDLMVLGAESFYRVGPAEFGMPGLIAIESVGPFVELMTLGPFITIHDSFIEPGLGIGHHPHRSNERLFYILRGQIEHDDALNNIRDTMYEGDLARLTEGERGMLHREWNGRDDITTHAFILVYTPDVEPPIPVAAFDALRAHERVRVRETDGVETLQLIGGESRYRSNNSTITSFFDTSLDAGASVELKMPPNHGLLLYPLEGVVELGGGARLSASSDVLPEGPDAVAIAWSGPEGRELRLRAGEDGPARLLRIGFAKGSEDLVLHRPWRSP